MLKPIKSEIDKLYLNLINASDDALKISDQYLDQLERDVTSVASMFDLSLKEKYLKMLSQENSKLIKEALNLKENPKNIDYISLMQQFLNVCPILDHPNKQ